MGDRLYAIGERPVVGVFDLALPAPNFIDLAPAALGVLPWRPMLRRYVAAGTAPRAQHRTHAWAIIVATIATLCTACDFGTTPSASSTVSVRDYCREHGFIDGERRNEADELIAECSPGPTPNGGAYAIARYLDADGPANKADATKVEITEHDDDGNVVYTTTGTVEGD